MVIGFTNRTRRELTNISNRTNDQISCELQCAFPKQRRIKVVSRLVRC